jgi:glutaredoxin/glutathione-dependent peroxiredoxin
VQVKVVVGPSSQWASTADLLGQGRCALFGVPAAFSPTCSDLHLPGFLARAAELATFGVGRIFCVAVNDAYVMAAWARSQGVGDRVTMLADGNGDLARALGLELDMRSSCMGPRSRRFAAVLEDGVFVDLAIEEGTGLEVSSAEALLERLSARASS